MKQLLEDREVAQKVPTSQKASFSPTIATGISPVPKTNHDISTSQTVAQSASPLHEITKAAEENLSTTLKNEIVQDSPINLAVHSVVSVVVERRDKENVALVKEASVEEVTVTSPKTELNLNGSQSSVPLADISPAPLTQLQPNKSTDFLEEFTAIETEEQKMEYKELYSKGLAVYREQYQVIDSYNQMSEQLARKLRAARAKADQAKMEKVKENVRRRFKEMQEDARCQAALANFQHLHEKLGHIRMLVERRLEEERMAGLEVGERPADTMPIIA